jgi:hypothetical protein
MKELPGKITITRTHCNDGNEYIEINVEDVGSNNKFLKVKVGLYNFTRALMNEYGIPMEFEVSNLEAVGKVKESMELIFPADNRDQALRICQEFANDGWTAYPYFGSQSSLILHKDGFYWAHGTQYRYVDRLKEDTII